MTSAMLYVPETGVNSVPVRTISPTLNSYWFFGHWLLGYKQLGGFNSSDIGETIIRVRGDQCEE